MSPVICFLFPSVSVLNGNWCCQASSPHSPPPPWDTLLPASSGKLILLFMSPPHRPRTPWWVLPSPPSCHPGISWAPAVPVCVSSRWRAPHSAGEISSGAICCHTPLVSLLSQASCPQCPPLSLSPPEALQLPSASTAESSCPVFLNHRDGFSSACHLGRGWSRGSIPYPLLSGCTTLSCRVPCVSEWGCVTGWSVRVSVLFNGVIRAPLFEPLKLSNWAPHLVMVPQSQQRTCLSLRTSPLGARQPA